MRALVPASWPLAHKNFLFLSSTAAHKLRNYCLRRSREKDMKSSCSSGLKAMRVTSGFLSNSVSWPLAQGDRTGMRSKRPEVTDGSAFFHFLLSCGLWPTQEEKVKERSAIRQTREPTTQETTAHGSMGAARNSARHRVTAVDSCRALLSPCLPKAAGSSRHSLETRAPSARESASRDR